MSVCVGDGVCMHVCHCVCVVCVCEHACACMCVRGGDDVCGVCDKYVWYGVYVWCGMCVCVCMSVCVYVYMCVCVWCVYDVYAGV